MELPGDDQRLNSRQLKVECQMAKLSLGIGEGSFAQFRYHNCVALDAYFDAVHYLRKTLQAFVGQIEAVQAFRVGVVIQPLVVEKDQQIAQGAVNFLNSRL